MRKHLYLDGATKKLKRRWQKKRMSRAAHIARKYEIHMAGCTVCTQYGDQHGTSRVS